MLEGDAMRTRCFSRGSAFAIVLCATSFLRVASADPIAYAENDSEYVRIDLGAGTSTEIAPLSQTFLVGAFAGTDFTQEYAIDVDHDLYTIDVASGAPTRIGNTGLVSTPSAMAWDSSNGTTLMLAVTADCTATEVYVLDLGAGATQLVAFAGGCLHGLVAANDHLYSIDTGSEYLVDVVDGPIGPLGVDFDDISAFYADPASGQLYLLGDDADAGANGLYSVDALTGQATLVAPWPDRYTAFALVVDEDPPTIFANGFDPGAATPR
jgi:hypothetical protein